ncbi:unnamed protein product [Adineta steineri]|uniref:NAD(P)(+)--arginine ADP-ribosyltransferase n=1 Tax=Adineta steineri TaxID=433720 RepID=A0A820A562_9BILA|nr:unnamed protein product [Adineta steineri]CAF4187770.1 unnamed protein product [Adineta steineri]
MAKSMKSSKNSRFTDLSDEPIDHLLCPIKGYQDQPLVSLIESIKPICEFFNEIQDNIYVALHNCQERKDDLTQDESASIYLYTMEFDGGPSLYYLLNQSLRAENRNELKPWFSFLKLFLTALYKLPSQSTTVWRGIRNVDLTSKYKTGTKIAWWGVSSCTTNIEVLESEQFLGKNGLRTLVSIECFNGKSIINHAYFKNTEQEIVLLPGSYFEVIGKLNPAPQLHIIQLKEIIPQITLIKPPFSNNSSFVPKKTNTFSQSSSSSSSKTNMPNGSITIDLSEMQNRTLKPTSTSEKLNEQAKIRFKNGDYISAIEFYSYALEQVPNYAPYLTNRALCYSHLNNPNKVLKDATTSIESDPQWTKGYYYKGKALEMLNHKEEALKFYRKCCQLEPNKKEYENALKECLKVSQIINTSSVNPIIHNNVYCDLCQCSPIIGIRYKCKVCCNYDLCSKCVQLNRNHKGHSNTHELISIKEPKQNCQFTTNSMLTQMFNFECQQNRIVFYNIILVVDVSLSMIGYESYNQINPLKNRWPITERGIIKIVNQLNSNDRFTCLAFNAKVYEIMDSELISNVKMKLNVALSYMKPNINDMNSGTALYDAIHATSQILLKNKLTGLLSNDSNRNQIILITDGEDSHSTNCNLQQACQLVNQICNDLDTDLLLIGIGLEFKGKQAMNQLKHFGGDKCQFSHITSLNELDEIFNKISGHFIQRISISNV